MGRKRRCCNCVSCSIRLTRQAFSKKKIKMFFLSEVFYKVHSKGGPLTSHESSTHVRSCRLALFVHVWKRHSSSMSSRSSYKQVPDSRGFTNYRNRILTPDAIITLSGMDNTSKNAKMQTNRLWLSREIPITATVG